MYQQAAGETQLHEIYIEPDVTAERLDSVAEFVGKRLVYA
jgi:hypothetical protein